MDVRSQPYSSYSKHFCEAPLRRLLKEAGLAYLFMGRELGGRPPEPEFYDEDGHVLYGELAATERFGQGLRRLVDGATRYRVAVMCSEENPISCHRRRLITRALRETGPQVTILHIRGTGDAVTDAQLDEDVGGTGRLGIVESRTRWRSQVPAQTAQMQRGEDPVGGQRFGQVDDRSAQPEFFGDVTLWG